MFGDLIGTVGAILLFIGIIAFCCSSDNNGSSNTATNRNTTSKKRNTNTYYGGNPYSECPSCGAPYYDGYCEECGYPDINQGWLGENY